MDNKKIIIGFHEELNVWDTETQTYGCRHTNPDICSNNSLPNICAFSSKDCICKRPSRSWKKQYNTLIEKNKKITS